MASNNPQYVTVAARLHECNPKSDCLPTGLERGLRREDHNEKVNFFLYIEGVNDNHASRYTNGFEVKKVNSEKLEDVKFF